jgi:outer membrane protein
MKVLVVVLALGVAATPAIVAQAPAPAQTPQSKPAPTAPAPRPQGQTPAPPTQPAAPAPLPPPFQDGFKYGFIRFDYVAQRSADGQRATQEIRALEEQRQKEITDKDQALGKAREKLQTQGGVMSESARITAQREIERMEVDIQRNIEDAENDVKRLTGQLQKNFMDKLQPIIAQLAKEKKLDLIFNAAESGLVWAAPGMDLTTDIIRALDAVSTAKPAAASPPAAAPPAAPAPAPVAPPLAPAAPPQSK